MKSFKISKILCYLGIMICLFSMGLHIKVEGLRNLTLKEILMFEWPLCLFVVLLYKLRNTRLFSHAFEESNHDKTDEE